jgi:hypothetical protein
MENLRRRRDGAAGDAHEEEGHHDDNANVLTAFHGCEWR